MDVSPLTWWLTIGITTAVLLVRHRRHRHGGRTSPPARRSASRSAVFVGLAVVFGIGIWVFAGHQYGTEFFAGWLTEYSLSVDNLFIFLIIMNKFAVPKQLQQSALLVGIVLALIMRGIFIAVGAAAINNFSWVFYIFGALPRSTRRSSWPSEGAGGRGRVRGEPPDQVRRAAVPRDLGVARHQACSSRRTASG